MSRPVWTGSLGFGPMNVPVRLYGAVSPKQVQFHLLHDADGARIQNKRGASSLFSVTGEPGPRVSSGSKSVLW